MGVELKIEKCDGGYLCSYIHPHKEYQVVRFFTTRDEVYSLMNKLDIEFCFCIARWV